jgi:hypothetical protein
VPVTGTDRHHDGPGSLTDRARQVAVTEKREYEGGSDRPLGGYLGVIVTYLAALGGFGLVLRRSRRKLPARIDAGDVALLATATFKLSRLLSKAPVTSPLRAPFTRFEGGAGPAELQEQPRGTGARHVLGSLVACPFCVGMWVATAFAFGLVLVPRATRFAASILAVLTGADVLHFAYAALEQKTGA